MSDEPRIIRRGASHDTIWRLWSTAQVKRLAALSPADLLFSVQTGAIADLTPDDQGQVLAALAASGYSHAGPAVTTRLPRRRPLPFKGAGLPCEAPTVVRPPRIRLWLALALAVATWGTSIGLGYAGLASHTEDVP